MDNVHELAMLTAQMWGEANAHGAEHEQFGADFAEAYQGAANRMEYLTCYDCPSDLGSIASMRVV